MNLNLKKFAVMILSAVFALTSATADESAPGTGNTGDRNMRGSNRRMRGGNRGGMRGGNRNMRGGMMMGGFSRIIAEEQIRAKFPKESAELDKALYELDLKYAELAEKAGVKLQPSLESNLRKLRILDPAGYSAAIAELQKNPRTGFPKMMELAKKHNVELFGNRVPGAGAPNRENAPQGRQINRPNFRELRSKFPEEMKQYEKLRRENPAEAANMLKQLIQRLKSENSGK